jgi:hypothetical protein
MNAQDNATTGRSSAALALARDIAGLVLQVVVILAGLGVLVYLGLWYLIWFTFKDSTFGF